MARPAPTYVVKVGTRSPRRRAALVALAVVLSGAAGWGIYDFGRYMGGYERGRQAREFEQMRADIAELRRQNDSLLARAARLQQGNKIDQYAYKDVSQSLKGLQDEIYELKEEVAFYRTILEPGQSAKGLRIQSLRLARDGRTNQYRYRLVLTQVITEARPIQGDVEMTVYGQDSSKPDQLSLSDMTSGQDRQLHFRFKYFQKLQGEVVFPEGFLPARVVLRVTPKGKSGAAVERTFDWNEIKA